MNLKEFLRKVIRVVLPLGLGCILLWHLYQDQDLSEMLKVIKTGVRYDILFGSLVFGLGANAIRGYRWGLLIDALGKKVKRVNTVLAVFGNYAINMALPRVGEIWRCGIIARYEKVPFSKLLGTLVIDRVMDTLVVGMLTLCVAVFNISFFRRYLTDHPEFLSGFHHLFTSVWLYVTVATVAICLWLMFARLGHLSFVMKTRQQLQNVWEGVRSIWKMKHKPGFIVQTVLIWVGYFLYFYVTFYAFDFTRDLGPRIGLIAFTMSSIAVAVPIQGGIGVWHFAVISTLTGFGVSGGDASAFALVVYTVQSVLCLVLVGIASIFALSVINRKNS
ncbi:MAG: flippase-like domain-containing protein [Tannerella sp.]|jgi:uncharacterized protein (TIRG00374 family)|nr:flippase-like domain-containing protein [Tannerella sp.]